MKRIARLMVIFGLVISQSSAWAYWAPIFSKSERLSWVTDPSRSDGSGFDKAEACLIYFESSAKIASYTQERAAYVLYFQALKKCFRLKWESKESYEAVMNSQQINF